jgi:hypothetical protein
MMKIIFMKSSVGRVGRSSYRDQQVAGKQKMTSERVGLDTPFAIAQGYSTNSISFFFHLSYSSFILSLSL